MTTLIDKLIVISEPGTQMTHKRYFINPTTRKPDGIPLPAYVDKVFMQPDEFNDLPDDLHVTHGIVWNMFDYDDHSNVPIKLPNNLTADGDLILVDAPIEALPNNLIVGRTLYLIGSRIKSIPDDLVVGRNIVLSGTQIERLPDNLVIGCHLKIGNTPIKELPEGLVVGGMIEVNQHIRAQDVPSSVKIGGLRIYGPWLGGCLFDQDGSAFPVIYGTKNKLDDVAYEPGRYLYTNYKLIHVKDTYTTGDYTVYVGKIPYRNVVSDGEHYVHCANISDGLTDITKLIG